MIRVAVINYGAAVEAATVEKNAICKSFTSVSFVLQRGKSFFSLKAAPAATSHKEFAPSPVTEQCW